MALLGTWGVALLWEGMVSLEELCHWAVGSEVSETQARPRSSLFLLPDDPCVELPAISPALFLPTCCHAPFHDGHGLNL